MGKLAVIGGFQLAILKLKHGDFDCLLTGVKRIEMRDVIQKLSLFRAAFSVPVLSHYKH